MTAPQRANILWICTDQQRADSLGCMGNAFAETPRLDALAGEGSLLERLISANPVCMPSRASMMTGCYPTRHGVVTNGIPLAQRAADDHPRRSHNRTIAHHLADQGYHTRCIGKLHLQPHQAEERYGFRESYAMWKSGRNEEWTGPLYGFDHLELSEGHGAQVGGAYIRWLKERDPLAAERLLDKSTWRQKPCSLHGLQPAPILPEQSATWWVADRFANFLSEPGSRERPFFCWVGIPDPHHPWQPPERLADRFSNREFSQPAPAEREDAPSWWPEGFTKNIRMEHLDDAAACVAWVRRYTDAQNALIDQAVGQILDALKNANLYDETVILFTSDHGDFLGDYGLLRKAGVSCASLNHVPGIIRDPMGSLPATIRGVCGNVDLAPTLCQAAGVPWDVPDGRALQQGPRPSTFVPCFPDPEGRVPVNFSLWTDTERLTLYPTLNEIEYYDHQTDPLELQNTAAAHPVRVNELRDQLLMQIARSSGNNSGRYSGW